MKLIRAMYGASYNTRLDDSSLSRLNHIQEFFIHNEVKVSMPVIIRRAILEYALMLDQEGNADLDNELKALVLLSIGGLAELEDIHINPNDPFPSFNSRLVEGKRTGDTI